MNKLLVKPTLYGKHTAKAIPRARMRRGSFLVESSVSLFLLVVISLVLVDASINILKPRNWVMRQNLVDAFLSTEVAAASQVDFDDIVNGVSGWGTGTLATAAIGNAVTTNNVQMGLMPGFIQGGAGRSYTATVHRLRIPIQANTAVATFQPAAGQTMMGMADMGIRCYELQTHVVYSLDGATYVKSRSVIRSQ